MNIFVSWSGTRSHYVAAALRDWLPSVLQSVQPFISSHDIRKGTRGNVAISTNLELANVGIICLTPENLDKPWILFEAGALSKLSSAYVCTYLIDLESDDVPPPLGQFQHTQSTKVETYALVETINSELGDRAISTARLKEAFEVWWPKLDTKLQSLPERPVDEPLPSKRSTDDKLNELLRYMRRQDNEIRKSFNARRKPRFSPPKYPLPGGSTPFAGFEFGDQFVSGEQLDDIGSSFRLLGIDKFEFRLFDTCAAVEFFQELSSEQLSAAMNAAKRIIAEDNDGSEDSLSPRDQR